MHYTLFHNSDPTAATFPSLEKVAEHCSQGQSRMALVHMAKIADKPEMEGSKLSDSIYAHFQWLVKYKGFKLVRVWNETE